MTHLLRQCPVENSEKLIDRVSRLFDERDRNTANNIPQQQLDLQYPLNVEHHFNFGTPGQTVTEFLDFAAASVPSGGIYLFGGLMRDLAVFGKRGPRSDIDIVVEGDWSALKKHLIANNAQLNKFGGFRIHVGKWPIDIWHAKDTWAIKEGFVDYKGISSLLNTTILNWDGILYNWGTKKVICSDRYYRDISNLAIDIVLKNNPNPLGMAVRVFRHLWLKDPKKISVRAVNYLCNVANLYTIAELRDSEISSYGNSYLQEKAYHFFRNLSGNDQAELACEFRELSVIMSSQLELY